MPPNIRYDDPSFNATETVLERQYGLPAGLMSAIRTRGEKSNTNQVSPKGAKGVYQFMDATWAKFADPGAKPTDPEAAAVAAARYLSYGMTRYGGDIGAVAAEYNGGPKAAKAYLRSGDPGNKETRDYVGRILGAFGGQRVAQTPAVQPTPTLPSEFQLGDPMGTGAPLSGLGDEAYSRMPAAQNANLDVSLDVDLGIPGFNGMNDESLDAKIGSIVDEVLSA